jgi:hypothetical protein
MEDKHTQLKAKCLTCDLHFIVCTEHPEKHSQASLHCPECGQHTGQFLTWSQVVGGPIYRTVPGEAKPTDDLPTSGVKLLKAKDIVGPH